jgi:acetyltransferase-like isoleucine patch superfamily enzyme
MFKNLLFSIIRNIDGTAGNLLRKIIYKSQLKYLGKNVIIDTGVFMYGLPYISIDDNTHIDKSVILVASRSNLDLSYRAMKVKDNPDMTLKRGELLIGKNCHIAQYCMLFAYGGVKLGDYCVMSTGSKIYSLSSLSYNPIDYRLRTPIVPYSGLSPSIIGNIEFEENVWIGINVCVFPGVKIGRDSFIRSNSILLNSFPENSFIAGDPARYIKPRYGE